MKGIILAGGTGTRLRPMTSIVNKHLLPVGPYPMIHYAIAKMAEAGIDEIMLVMGKHSAGLYIDYIGSGRNWNVKVTFKIQEEAGGIAQAVALGEGFIGPGEKFLLLLGDNLFEDSLLKAVRLFKKQEHGAMVFLKQVDDPYRYGVPEMSGERIVAIEEKPSDPKSNYCVTGIYMYDDRIFDIIRTISPSGRGELEITDVNNAYASAGELSYTVLNGWWIDAGTHASLLEAALRFTEADTP